MWTGACRTWKSAAPRPPHPELALATLQPHGIGLRLPTGPGPLHRPFPCRHGTCPRCVPATPLCWLCARVPVTRPKCQRRHPNNRKLAVSGPLVPVEGALPIWQAAWLFCLCSLRHLRVPRGRATCACARTCAGDVAAASCRGVARPGPAATLPPQPWP